MADPSQTPPHRAPLEALGERVRRMTGLSRRFTLLLLWLTVSVCSAFLITPGLYSQHIPDLKPSDLGQPFRSSSPYGFKATRDYEIVHAETTAQRRVEASAAVRPVFDYDPAILNGLRKAVGEAFEGVREAQGLVESEGHSRADPSATPGGSGAAEKLAEAKRDFGEKVVPPEEEDFQSLLGAHVSPQVEQMALALIERAYLVPVVSARDDLTREGSSGITVRVLGGGTEHGSTVNPPVIVDVREAGAELDRFASVPGNLPPEWPGLLRRAVLRFAKLQIRANLFFNAEETKSRRDTAAAEVRDAVIQIKKGQKIIGDGELITPVHLVVLRGMGAQRDPMDLLQLQLGGAALVALLLYGTFAFFRSAFRTFRPTRKDSILLGLVLLGTLGMTHLWTSVADALHDRYPGLANEPLYYLAPVAVGAMLVRFLLSDVLALFSALVTSVLCALLLGNSLPFGIVVFLTSVVGAERVGHARERLGIFKAGLAVGVVGALASIALSLAEGKGLTVETVLTACSLLLSGAVVTPALMMALTPLVEGLFGYASDIKLLELANLNHPALKELIVQAPGTYHHSIIIGSLVEAAAEAIGANPLLARSCAYYHDIGKGKNPLYFGENQKGENRHDSLAPAMSAVIIKRHVTDGMELARQYKLPKLVADAIPQHHGTRLVGYFFNKAVKEQEGKENPQAVDESIYRYPGPKPRFREAALVMIADAVEAASRSLSELSSAKLQALVQKLINSIFTEGQLDECELTLKDLNLIGQSFARTLESIYHARPAYPAGAVGPPRAVEPLDSKRLTGG
jgi:cyclic-di-AMP phosphodiesterase PgpH